MNNNEINPLNANSFPNMQIELKKIKNSIEATEKGFYVEITYDELAELKANNNLVAGCWYRITDYQTTIKQDWCTIADTHFDVIVQAINSNTFNEDAKCIEKEGDFYFRNRDENLNAWRIKYQFENKETASRSININRFYYSVSDNGIYIEDNDSHRLFTLIPLDDSKPYMSDQFNTIDRDLYKDVFKNILAFNNYKFGDVKEKYNTKDKINEAVSSGDLILLSKPTGSIYEMIDSNGNQCPYDFKTIQFIRFQHDPYCYITRQDVENDFNHDFARTYIELYSRYQDVLDVFQPNDNLIFTTIQSFTDDFLLVRPDDNSYDPVSPTYGTRFMCLYGFHSPLDTRIFLAINYDAFRYYYTFISDFTNEVDTSDIVYNNKISSLDKYIPINVLMRSDNITITGSYNTLIYTDNTVFNNVNRNYFRNVYNCKFDEIINSYIIGGSEIANTNIEVVENSILYGPSIIYNNILTLYNTLLYNVNIYDSTLNNIFNTIRGYYTEVDYNQIVIEKSKLNHFDIVRITSDIIRSKINNVQWLILLQIVNSIIFSYINELPDDIYDQTHIRIDYVTNESFTYYDYQSGLERPIIIPFLDVFKLLNNN